VTPCQLRLVSTILRQGGVIAYPTEAVFGFGCDPQNQSAVMRILSLKQRKIDKGLILVASSNEQLLPYVDQTQLMQANVQSSWPGSTTWLVKASANAPPWIRGTHQTVAVRISQHPIILELCRHFSGAIVSTSANLSGKSAIKSALLIKKHFRDSINYVIHGNLGGNLQVSQIRDARTDAIIR